MDEPHKSEALVLGLSSDCSEILAFYIILIHHIIFFLFYSSA